MDHNKLWKTLKEMGISDHLTCLLRNLSQVKKQLLEPDMEQLTGSNLRKEYDKAIFLLPCLFNLDIKWNSRVDGLQAGVKMVRRNINNLRYSDDTTLMAEREEELKSLLMRVKEESEKASLWSHHFIGNRRGKGGSSDRFPLLWL